MTRCWETNQPLVAADQMSDAVDSPVGALFGREPER